MIGLITYLFYFEILFFYHFVLKNIYHFELKKLSFCPVPYTKNNLKEVEEKTKNLMKMIGLDYESFKDKYPAELSGGQQQRIGVARASKNNLKEVEEKTKNLMKMIGLDYESFKDKYPAELSGGQQQRIGVARAFSNNPKIILMDEPFSAIDPINRSLLQNELLKLQKIYNKTIVFVTHDIQEAVKIADKICIMRNGKIVQFDTPNNILKNPINEFVKNFMNII